MPTNTLTLYHPVTPEELDYIKCSDWTQLPAYVISWPSAL